MSDLNQETIEQNHAENWMASKAVEEFDKQQAALEALGDEALGDEAPEPVENEDLPC